MQALDIPVVFRLTAELRTRQLGPHPWVTAGPATSGTAMLRQSARPETVTQSLIAEVTQDHLAERPRSSLPNSEKEALKKRHLDAIQALSSYAGAGCLHEDAKAKVW